MNAIERLRAALDASDMAREYELEHDALAAVDALYQAAKEVACYEATLIEGPYVLVRVDEIAALAAAVRRVDGDA